jgi:hypothetical protein
MKQTMIDLMNSMMPYMRPLAIAGAGALLIAIVSRVMGARGLARLLAGLTALAGLFFLACEGAGRALGFEPTILFADPANRELFRNQFPFWLIGAALLVLGGLVRSLSRASR